MPAHAGAAAGSERDERVGPARCFGLRQEALGTKPLRLFEPARVVVHEVDPQPDLGARRYAVTSELYRLRADAGNDIGRRIQAHALEQDAFGQWHLARMQAS